MAEKEVKNFVIIGVGGYIAPRHLEAIEKNGHRLVAAFDPNDSVGILDRYAPECRFFTDFEIFEAFVESLKGTSHQIHFVSICSPNYLHLSHMKFALRIGAQAICEKPLVLTLSELNELSDLQKKKETKIYTILQLRAHPVIQELKRNIESQPSKMHKIDLVYMTSRGDWYLKSWKADQKKSGGLSTNIGIHFFDMLSWIFGAAKEVSLDKKTAYSEQGRLIFERAEVNWFMSIDRNELPASAKSAGKTSFRSMKFDGVEVEFSDGFTELHNKVYADIFSGQGYGIEDSRAAISIAEKIRNARPTE